MKANQENPTLKNRMSQNITSITDADFKADLFSSQRWTLLYFWAQWSGPCRLLSLFVDHAAKTYGDRLQVVKVDADLSPELAGHYRVQHVPTLYLLHEGKPIDSVEGVLSRPQLEQMLAAHLTQIPVR
jgi:thioredoxin 1